MTDLITRLEQEEAGSREFDINEKEACPVCGRTRLRFFSKDHCRHTPEEWAKADMDCIYGAWFRLRAIKEVEHG
ncbi:MAG: hypothetical protein LCH78_17900 [Proteobacteria bacterium]|nr:hypothetical protein [Pseudomonadota bacterium]